MNRKKIICILIQLAVTVAFISCSTKSTDIFVSPHGSDNNAGSEEMPVQTVEAAFEKAAAIRERSKKLITIHLLEGDYHLSRPLVITPDLNNLSLIGEGVDKVTVKGSKVIESNWEAFNENIWVTDINDEIDFTQLFINGEKQILARYPNFDEHGGLLQGHAEDAISKERVATWKNPTGGFVHAMHMGLWGGFQYEITGIDESGELMLTGGHQNNRPSAMHPKYRMVENIFEELDTEKEWYFDKANSKLYVWKDENTDMRTAMTEVSILKSLIELKGNEQNPVKNVLIDGINFQHAMPTFMEQYHQLLRSDWTIYRGGAILLDGTENCSVTHCEFTSLGGNVIFANGYNRNIEITGNHIHHCGASAICFVGDSTSVRSPSFQYNEFVAAEKIDTVRGPANNLFPAGCKVENNLIYKIGLIEKQVAGVEISMAMKIHVKNNSIYDVPRAGINVSEGTWGGHIIEFNDVFNTVLETGDHGSFNSWGRDRFWHPNWNTIDSLVHANPKMPYWDAMHTTIIRNNRFRCDHGWDIDLDDGSSNYHIYNNLSLNGGIKLREGFYRVVENNIMVNNGFHPHVWFSNSEDIFTRNIMMTKHFPIGLKGWGKSVDFNLFPDSVSLALAHANNTDANSLYGDPLFTHAGKGDFTVKENSSALRLGFKNFPMDKFGVQQASLKAIAKQPDIPELNIPSFYAVKKSMREWLGATLKNIETPEEQSAFGLHSMTGIVVLNVKQGGTLAKSGFREGDVIVEAEGVKVNTISALLSGYQENLWHGSVRLMIIRNQKQMEVQIKSQ